MKIGIIGKGRMGEELSRRCIENGWEVIIINRSDDWFRLLQGVDVVCLCISTEDDGEAAYDYIRPLAENEIPVVTCEKGALGNYFPDLEPFLDKIGYSATVGGETGMAPWFRKKMNGDVIEIQGVVNATLNFILSGLSERRAVEEVIREAIVSGYAEPGASEPWDVINKESTKDVPMKTAILFNSGIGGRFGPLIKARDIVIRPLQKNEFQKIVKEANTRRYVVSITKEERKEDVIGGFKHQAGDWIISAGFKRIKKNPLFRSLGPEGIENALLLIKATLIKRKFPSELGIIGKGAGPNTVSSMIRDIEKLAQIRKR